ncbi:hypothetical protein AYK26_07615 [Euryarchaeota archaeon SM23-78]|nr:MAG: hypothetical protein AYK26_07615 [Euryarchaeota archaeon SM23-78]
MKKLLYLLISLFILLACNVSAFDFYGYTKDVNGAPLNNTNISVEIYFQGGGGPPTLITTYNGTSDASGWFNVSNIIENISYSYKPVVRHYNSTTGDADYVSQSLPDLPLFDILNISPIDFYLKEGATINITAKGVEQSLEFVNETAHYSVADYQLGLEWDGSFWAYLNSSGNLIMLDSSFTKNKSYSVGMSNINAFDYANSAWYFVNATHAVKFIDNGSALNLTDIYNLSCNSSYNYTYISAIEYIVSDELFIVMGIRSDGNTTISNFNGSTFEFVSEEVIYEPPCLLQWYGDTFWIVVNFSGQYQILRNPEQGYEFWNISSPSIEGFENNGSAWFYGSAASGNITQFELLYDDGSKSFRYMVKDVALGYPIAENFDSEVSQATIYVPADRDYSIMLYPDMSFPVSYDLNNLSDYPANHADIVFNTSEQWRWVSGNMYLSNGTTNFDSIAIINFVYEMGMISQNHPMPYNISAWNGQSDFYNATDGYYEITLPGSAMTAKILMFALAKKGSSYYGAFRNISLNYSNASVTSWDFNLTELLGTETNITIEKAVQGPMENITIFLKKATFQLQNSSGNPLNTFAFTETEVDYTTLPDGLSFKWMQDVRVEQGGVLQLILLSGFGVRRMNIYSQQFTPKKTSFTAGQLAGAVGDIGINLTPNNEMGKGVDNESFSDLFIDMIKSNPQCDVPNYNRSACSLFPNASEMNKSGPGFNPFKIVLGGGKISFVMRKDSNNITVHYKNVDMLASGPPDALFDDSANETEIGSNLEMAWRFGSQGPEIYDEVLVGIPLSSDADLAGPVSILIEHLYDENWNAIWNVSVNGTPNSPLDLPTDFSDFNLKWFNQSTNGMPCSKTNITANCYVNPGRRMAWLRIPHFSGIGPTVQSVSKGNVSMDADDDDYVCSDGCLIYFNITNLNYTLSSVLRNITINYTDVNATGSISKIDIHWYNGSAFEPIGTDSSNQTNYNLTFYNGSASTLHRYMLNVSKSSDTETLLNITYNISDLNFALTISVALLDLDVNLVSPGNNSWTNDQTPEFIYNYTYPENGAVSCELFVGSTGYGVNTSVLNNTPITRVANASISEGSPAWNVRCTKDSNGVTSASRTINIDATAPIVTMHTTDTNTTNTTPTFNFSYTDAVSSAASCELFISGTGYSINSSVLNNTPTNITTNSSLSEGLYSVNVTCTDLVNNSDASTPITLGVDATGPSVTINSPGDGVPVYDNTTDINFTFTDGLSSKASCTVWINDTTMYGTNTSVLNYTQTIITINATEGLSETNHTLRVNCTDGLSNVGTSGAQSLIIDKTAPIITAISTSGTSSSTSSGTATITATTNENAVCWYKTTAFSANYTSGATAMSGSSTSHTFTKDYTATGTIGPYYISCRDTAGNNMTSSNSTGSISVTVTTGGGGGGGGGGGYTSNPSTSKSWDKMGPGAEHHMSITTDDFGVKTISIEVINPANNVKITIEKLPGQPATVTKEISGNVYRYLDIKKTNLEVDNIKGVIKIQFQISNSWLRKNGVDAADIVLMRYTQEEWEELKTTLLSDNGLITSYEAETPDFSYFAIAEKGAPLTPVPKKEETEEEEVTQEEEVTTPETPVEEGVVTGEEELVAPEEEIGEQKPRTLGIILFIIAGVLLAMLIALIILKKKRPKAVEAIEDKIEKKFQELEEKFEHGKKGEAAMGSHQAEHHHREHHHTEHKHTEHSHPHHHSEHKHE